MFKKRLTFKIFIFLICTDILETLIQFCFKKGVLTTNTPEVKVFSDFLLFLFQVFHSPFLWLGFIFVFLTFSVWSTILSKIDLSVAVPAASFSYILVPLTSVIFLHEKITLLRWSGIFFILIGVIFVSISSKEKEAHLG